MTARAVVAALAGAALLCLPGPGRAEWWPAGRQLFPAPLADPTQPAYAARLGGADGGRTHADVNLGEEFGILSWAGGRRQVGVAVGVASRFDLSVREVRELQVADYTLAVPVDFDLDRLALRLSYLHVSSHLGDDRIAAQDAAPLHKRASDELRLDVSVPFEPLPGLLARGYAAGGYAYNVLPDGAGRARLQGGGELRRDLPSLRGALFAAVDLQVLERAGWEPALTARVGWESEEEPAALTLFVEYATGPPPYLALLDEAESRWGVGLALRR